MLRGNLSTRPFYNERLVGIILLLATIAGIALTVFNVTTTYRLQGERVKQQEDQGRIDSEADKIRRSAETLKNSLDPSNLRLLAGETFEANELIEQRTFSWTAFFGLVEKTLPRDARLISVAPRVEKGVFFIDMTLNVKHPDDLEAFMDALAGTGAFYNLLPGDMQRNEDGIYIANLESAYTAPGVEQLRAKPSTRKGGPRP